MIYYGERKRPDNKITIKEPQTVWDKVKDFFSADYYPNGVPLPNNMPPLGEKNSGGTWLPIPRRGIPFMPLR
ncbi:hypothetical protein OHJ21_14960 [Virgibacillus sp. LDC1]|nr:hypothetical protein [Virgibacillus sp. LDC1]